MEIIDKLGVSEEEFQKNTVYHSHDQMKVMKMMQVQKQQNYDKEMKCLTKQEVFETFKVQ